MRPSPSDLLNYIRLIHLKRTRHGGLDEDANSVSAAVTAPNVRVPAEPSLLLHVCWLSPIAEAPPEVLLLDRHKIDVG